MKKIIITTIITEGFDDSFTDEIKNKNIKDTVEFFEESLTMYIAGKRIKLGLMSRFTPLSVEIEVKQGDE